MCDGTTQRAVSVVCTHTIFFSNYGDWMSCSLPVPNTGAGFKIKVIGCLSIQLLGYVKLQLFCRNFCYFFKASSGVRLIPYPVALYLPVAVLDRDRLCARTGKEEKIIYNFRSLTLVWQFISFVQRYVWEQVGEGRGKRQQIKLSLSLLVFARLSYRASRSEWMNGWNLNGKTGGISEPLKKGQTMWRHAGSIPLIERDSGTQKTVMQLS